MKILCLKHIAFEGPGAFAIWAHTRGHELDVVPVYTNPHLPPPNSYDALLLMGGPMNVYEDDKYPWLANEKATIRGAIAANKYVIGVCLGAQLIAHTLGSKITRAQHKEIGWHSIQPSVDYNGKSILPNPIKAFHWHGDTFSLPKAAKNLASSEACPQQIFLHRKRVLGLQCHLEMTQEGIALLTAACSNELTKAAYIQTAEEMLAEPQDTFSLMHQQLFTLLDMLIN